MTIHGIWTSNPHRKWFVIQVQITDDSKSSSSLFSFLQRLVQSCFCCVTHITSPIGAFKRRWQILRQCVCKWKTMPSFRKSYVFIFCTWKFSNRYHKFPIRHITNWNDQVVATDWTEARNTKIACVQVRLCHIRTPYPEDINNFLTCCCYSIFSSLWISLICIICFKRLLTLVVQLQQ